MDSLCSTSSEKGYFSPSVLKGRKNVKNENLNEEYRLIDFIFLSKQNSSVHSFLIWFLSIRHFQFLPLSFHIYCVLFKKDKVVTNISLSGVESDVSRILFFLFKKIVWRSLSFLEIYLAIVHNFCKNINNFLLDILLPHYFSTLSEISIACILDHLKVTGSNMKYYFLFHFIFYFVS